MRAHWDNVYNTNTTEKLGWYQESPQPDLDLIDSLGLSESASVLVIGAGTSTIIEYLLDRPYKENLILTDISTQALAILQERLRMHKKGIRFIQDDLTSPQTLYNLDPVDLWYDRAVLHFLDNTQRVSYKELLERLVKPKGHVIIGVFSEKGATRCSGLDVYRYSKQQLNEFLGDKFDLIHSLEYTYINPSGDDRPYVYCTFQRH